MKTIFRYTNIALLSAALLAVAALGTFAQDVCGDAVAQSADRDKITEQAKGRTTIEGRKTFGNTGKAFVEKFGACESAKDMVDWLKVQLPRNDEALKKMEADAAKAALLKRFDDSLKAKNWDETYASGKEVLQKYPGEFLAVELVLGSIGYDENFKATPVTKYNDDTLRFAKQALANLDAGKEFKPSFGLAPFLYKTKEDATGWMNLTIGYITQVAQKNKTAAAPYLFKATQATASDTSKNPIPYELIGFYYFDELNKVVDQIKAKEAEQKDTDTPEVATQKVEDLKKLVAMSNGVAERAMDAFSRAYTLGQAAPYKAKMKKNAEDAYKVRFGKVEGLDAWISSAVAKPFVNPTTPIAPVSDPEPVKTATTTTPGTGMATGSGTGIGAANGTGMGAANGSGIGRGTGTGVGTGTGTGMAPTVVAKPATTPAKSTTPAPKTTKPAKPGVAKTTKSKK